MGLYSLHVAIATCTRAMGTTMWEEMKFQGGQGCSHWKDGIWSEMQEVGEEFMKISDRGGVIYAEETANAKSA